MKKSFCSLIADDSGATAIEYGLIAALVSVVIIVSVGKIGSNLSTVFNNIATNLVGATTPSN